MQQALAQHDYESAAECVATFLQLESRLSLAVRGMDGVQVEEQRQVRWLVQGLGVRSCSPLYTLLFKPTSCTYASSPCACCTPLTPTHTSLLVSP